MERGHVYSDPEFLGGKRMAQKSAVLRARGARHASIRFVAGELDPFATRAEFLESASRVAETSLLIYGAETPPKSKPKWKRCHSRTASKLMSFRAGNSLCMRNFLMK